MVSVFVHVIRSIVVDHSMDYRVKKITIHRLEINLLMI